MNKAILILPIVAIALNVIPIPIAHAQTQNPTDCKQQGVLLVNRANTWNNIWGNATNDAGGNIRTEGRQIVSDITTFLVNCQGSYDRSTLHFLLVEAVVFSAEIAGDINYGPPCNPTCASGPPLT